MGLEMFFYILPSNNFLINMELKMHKGLKFDNVTYLYLILLKNRKDINLISYWIKTKKYPLFMVAKEIQFFNKYGISNEL